MAYGSLVLDWHDDEAGGQWKQEFNQNELNGVCFIMQKSPDLYNRTKYDDNDDDSNEW